MRVKHSVSNNSLYIYFCGELDECTAVKTRDIIDKIIDDYSYVKNVIFDLKMLTFMDSTGIGMLIGRYKKIKAKKLSAYIQNPSVLAERILEISGLYKIMPKI